MALGHGPRIVTDGLVLALDAADKNSYPGSGTTWTDLSGNGNNGTLVNGVGYNGSNGGSLSFDGVDDFVNQSSPSLNLTDFSFSAWINGNGIIFGSGVQETWPRYWFFNNRDLHLDQFK